jgi:hypothetical protein
MFRQLLPDEKLCIVLDEVDRIKDKEVIWELAELTKSISIVIKKKEYTKGKGCYPRESSPKPTQKETSPHENNLFAKNRQPVARPFTSSL